MRIVRILLFSDFGCLLSYFTDIMRSGVLQPCIAAGIVSNIGALQDTLTNLGRIANTPLPFAYQMHLRMSLWIYLFLLPVRRLFFVLTYSDTISGSSKSSTASNT